MRLLSAFRTLPNEFRFYDFRNVACVGRVWQNASFVHKANPRVIYPHRDLSWSQGCLFFKDSDGEKFLSFSPRQKFSRPKPEKPRKGTKRTPKVVLVQIEMEEKVKIRRYDRQNKNVTMKSKSGYIIFGSTRAPSIAPSRNWLFGR